jgi:hypothetical protein
MNAWIVELGRGRLDCCANWTWRKLIDANQTAQELREKDIGYFEGAVTSKTPKDVLSFDNTRT